MSYLTLRFKAGQTSQHILMALKNVCTKRRYSEIDMIMNIGDALREFDFKNDVLTEDTYVNF